MQSFFCLSLDPPSKEDEKFLALKSAYRVKENKRNSSKKRIRSYEVALVRKVEYGFKEWEMIKGEEEWMQIKCSKSNNFLELSAEDGEPTVQSMHYLS